jgi:hypothetical protein
MDDQNPRSFFEAEALRLAELNKHKHVPPVSFTKALGDVLQMLIGGVIGGGIVLTVLFLTSAYAFLAHGFVAMKLWQWFIVPSFHVEPISVMVAGGIMLLVRLFTYQNTPPTKKEDERSFKEKVLHFIGIILIPWYSLLIGWLAHFLI